MSDEYTKMMKQTMKAAGMSDEQIEAALAMQKSAMAQYANAAFDSEAFKDAAQNAMQSLGDLNMDSYFEFSEKPSINKSYQWAVACGADLIHARADIINDLSTGGDGEMIKEMLERDWGIASKEDFVEMADSLLNGRHSSVYKKLAEGKSVKNFEEEMENLKKAKKQFTKDKLVSGDALPNMLIWDLGRLVNISRFAFDAGLASKKTALSYIKEAALLVKKNYKSWQELSIGYQFGRAVWNGLDQYQDLKEGMEQLLTEKDSPWVTLPFTMKLEFEPK